MKKGERKASSTNTSCQLLGARERMEGTGVRAPHGNPGEEKLQRMKSGFKLATIRAGMKRCMAKGSPKKERGREASTHPRQQ